MYEDYDEGFGSMSLSSSDFQNLSSDQEKINSLNELCTFLCIGMEDFIQGFDVHGWSSVLIPLLKEKVTSIKSLENQLSEGSSDVSEIQNEWNQTREIVTLILRALGIVLEMVPRSVPTVLSYHPIESLLELLKQFSNSAKKEEEEEHSNSLRATDLFGEFVNESMLEEILKCFDKISIEEPTSLFNTVTKEDDDNTSSGAGFIGILLNCLDSPMFSSRIKQSALKTICNLFRKMRVKEDFSTFIEQAGALEALIRQINIVTSHSILSNASGDVNSTRQSLQTFKIICDSFAYIIERSRFQKGSLKSKKSKKESKSTSSIIETVASQVANTSMLTQMLEKLGEATDTISHASATISRYIISTLHLYSDASPKVLNEMVNPNHFGRSLFLSLKKWIDPQQQDYVISGNNEKVMESFNLLQDSILYFLSNLFPEVDDSKVIAQYIYGGTKYYWEDDYHNLNEYDEIANAEIEKYYREGHVDSQFNINIAGRFYKIDLLELKQYSSANLMRNIKRDPIPCSFSRDVCLLIGTTESSQSKESSSPTSKTPESPTKKEGFFTRFFKKQKPNESTPTTPTTPQPVLGSSRRKSSSTKPTLTKSKDKFTKVNTFSKLDSENKRLISEYALEELIEPLIALSTNEFYRKDCLNIICKILNSFVNSHQKSKIPTRTLQILAKYAIKTLNQYSHHKMDMDYTSPTGTEESDNSPMYLTMSAQEFSNATRLDSIVITNCLHIIHSLLRMDGACDSVKKIILREGFISTLTELIKCSKETQSEPIEDTINKIIQANSQIIIESYFSDKIHQNHTSVEEIKLNSICSALEKNLISGDILKELANLLNESTISSYLFEQSKFVTYFTNALISSFEAIEEVENYIVRNRDVLSNIIELLHSLIDKLSQSSFKTPDTSISEATVKKFASGVILNVIPNSSQDWKGSIKAEPLITIRSIENFIASKIDLHGKQLQISVDGNLCDEPSITLFEAVLKKKNVVLCDEAAILDFFSKEYEISYELVDNTSKLKKFLNQNIHQKMPPTNNPFNEKLLQWILQFKEDMKLHTQDLTNSFILLKILFELNRKNNNIIDTSNFQNPQVASKFIIQQSKDSYFIGLVLAMISGTLPSWMYNIATHCGTFLLPLSTRRNFFFKWSGVTLHPSSILQSQCGAVGDSNDTRIGRKKSEKVKIMDREKIVAQTLTQIKPQSFSSKSILEFEYENEVGTGLGPTRAFFDLLSRELQKKQHCLWMNQSSDDSDYVKTAYGIFPDLVSENRSKDSSEYLSVEKQSMYSLVGSLIGKAIEDGRLLDFECNLNMIDMITSNSPCQFTDYSSINPTLFNSINTILKYATSKKNIQEGSEEWEKLKSEIDLLGLDFTFGNYKLKPLEGISSDVTIHNIEEYVSYLTNYLCNEGVMEQVNCIRFGLREIISDRGLKLLNSFSPDEISLFIKGSDEIWKDKQSLLDCIQCSHGYTINSEPILFLIEWLLSLSLSEQKLFLQFVTGCSRIPIDGLKITIVEKTGPNPDNTLPTSNTCFNYLKLPAYTSLQTLKLRMETSIQLGRNTFDLS